MDEKLIRELESKLEQLRVHASPALDERVKALIAHPAGGAQNAETTMEERKTMFRMIRTVGGKIGLAAAVVAVVAGATCYLFAAPSVALADVLANVNAARTAKFTSTMKRISQSKELPPIEAVNMLKDGRMRVIVQGDGGSTIMISDLEAGKMLTLSPDKKKAVLFPIGKRAGNFFDKLRGLQAVSEDKLGARKIDGKTAVGFHVLRDGEDWTIWADPISDLPVQVEMKDQMGGISMMIAGFVFNEEMDDSLFSLTPPDGYDLTQVAKTDISVATEEDLIKGLRAATAVTGGTFPPEFNMVWFAAAVEESRGKGITLPKELSLEVSHGYRFARNIPPEGDWHYVGMGVEAGDAGKAICWWRPDGAEKYRVVYGDFSVRDVSASELPFIPPQ